MFLKEMMSVILISVHISLNVQVYLSLMGNKIERKGHCVLWGSDVLDGGEEPNQKEELYEMLEENIHNILIEKSKIEEKINEKLIKFQDDEKLLQLKQRMKEIFKEPNMPDPVFSIDNSLQGSHPIFDLDASPTYEKNEYSKRKEKENGIKSIAKQTVDLPLETTKDESFLEEAIFSTQEAGRREVFNDDERTILFRMNIQSLAPGLEIDTSVLGILEDKTQEINKKIDAEYDRFHEMLSIQMQNDVRKKMQMEDVELVY
ncbi:hypothetical protein Tco_0978180 [Tanacetum coccineum]|uniref:Uncharacterized protein n=1 Tax=Tanacetum coccineum TaxID=301880 RepID=A0ABQ5EM75_9ASTR